MHRKCSQLVAAAVMLCAALVGCRDARPPAALEPPTTAALPSSFNGTKAGDQCEVAGVQLRWCPPGKFIMGSPPGEPERRPGEDQVEVTLTKGFWIARFEATQGQWKRVAGKLPGDLTAELPAGDDLPVGNVNFAETETFCRRLTELGHESGDLPKTGSSACPLKPSGSTPAGQDDNGDLRSAIRSAASRRTSRARRTTAASRGQRSVMR
jgi:formylglycine-generating enzyme required for sulfatase activity